MSPAYCRYVTTLIALTLVCVTRLYAQDDQSDYLQYKFYKEDIGTTNDLWLTAIERDEYDDNIVAGDFVANTLYSLSTLGFQRRGEGYHAQRYLVGELDISYSTARMLRALGLRHDDHIDAEGDIQRYFKDRDAQYYPGHYIRAEFSGCNYLGGVSHRASYKPLKNGVRLDDGWSFGHHARLRTGRDIYVDGVYSNSLDIAAMATFRDRRDWLNIALMLPLSERGLRSASVEEAYTLTDNRLYNPSWGVQDGKVRNSRVATTLRPEVVALWQRRLTAVTTMTLGANLCYEWHGYTTLAWFNALSPAPDNYRYLPSFYTDDDTSREVREAWLGGDEQYTQIDWQGLYHTNALQQDGSARYAVERRQANMLRTAAALAFESRVGDVDAEYGIEVDYRTVHEFKVMDDLLGASHIVDIDYYLIDDATYANNLQNDLRNPNRTIVEGDRYGYDYRLSRLGVALYGSALYAWEDMTIVAKLRIGMDNTSRRGYYEKELFPDAGSYGRSRNLTTNPYHINVAWRYNLGSHTLSVSAALHGTSPDMEDMFLQTQYNNRATEEYRLTTLFRTNISYRYTHHKVGVAATLFCRTSSGESDVLHYYDDLASLYSDAVISGIGRISLGIEASATVRWGQYLSSTAMLTAAMYRYRGNAKVQLYADTDNDLIATSYAATKGLHTGAPELAAYGDITFRHSGWMARLGLSYAGMRYVEPSVVRRTERVLSFTQSPEERTMLSSEEHLDDAVMLDATLSKRIKLKGDLRLNIQLSARNLLGSSHVRNGSEQSRIRRTTTAGRTFITPFANRLTYTYPRTFYLAASLWF
ncbi:MAG: hypothetical protein IJ464_07325 [Alistipes sp.]|nr:hypothetical protein [Alistipes sp.]